MERLHNNWVNQGENLASLNVIVEDNSFEPPSSAVCTAWRAEYDQRRVLTVYDATGASGALWDENLTALNVVLDNQRVITAKVHTDVEAELNSAIAAALE
jgi:hypothetical protein